jgi:hypothetical protein
MTTEPARTRRICDELGGTLLELRIVWSWIAISRSSRTQGRGSSRRSCAFSGRRRNTVGPHLKLRRNQPKTSTQIMTADVTFSLVRLSEDRS